MSRRPRGRGQRSVGASIALHATLITATVIALFPVVWVFLSSLKPRSAIQSSRITLFDQPSLDNYRRVLLETSFPTWFLNSIVVAGLTMVFGMAMSATAGYALSRFNFPGKRGLMWLFLVTQKAGHELPRGAVTGIEAVDITVENRTRRVGEFTTKNFKLLTMLYKVSLTIAESLFENSFNNGITLE